jgi:hypothetical protein
MKRKDSRYRPLPSSRFVRPIENHHSNLFRLPSASGQPSVRVTKIFILKRTSRPFDSRSQQTLAATNVGRKKIRRILIFDNHPDSLRLVFGRRADSHLHLSDPQRMTSSGVALLWILIVGLMVAMLWPLF